MKRYNPKEIEPLWQQKWAEEKIYQAKDFDSRQKYVMLTEFPYPSGAGMHVGHMREYTIGDIIARYKRMQGFNVLYPMAYDAFGLPTENYAIKHKISPQKATEENVATFQKQLESVGFSFDWSRSLKTSDPEYYKWTQWLFLQFYKAGLAYQDEIAINWCPLCKTGLANEEVVNGRHERCDTPVEKKLLKQWMMKITAYADRLIDGLSTVDYPPRIAGQQINWIGKSKGAEIDFALDFSDEKTNAWRDDDGKPAHITVFTTRPDTIFGATFLVLAPEHPWVTAALEQYVLENKADVAQYVKQAQQKSDLERQSDQKDKTGVQVKGVQAINPANNEKIPIFVADYVLPGYGTGAIMAVPAHDDRDYAFAEKFNLSIIPVVALSFMSQNEPTIEGQEPHERPTAIAIGHDSKTDTYCVIDWFTGWRKNIGYEWPGGGVDDSETVEQAAVREFAEEAGYNDVTIEQVLPAAIVFYYLNKKGQNKRAVKKIVKLRVNSFQQNAEIGADDYEKNAYEIRWLKRDEILANQTPLNRAISEFVFNQTVHVGEGEMVNSGKYDRMKSANAREKIMADLVKNGAAEEKINYRLRDWIFSRQHYWGEPIPIIHCSEHGAVPVPDEDLPVELPKVDHYEPTDSGESPLADIESWVNTTCPICGKPSKRETDTMPNWAGSSWYYLRYFDPKNDRAFAGKDKLAYWQNVDMYLGGMEHTTLHLLYSRFWHKFLYDQQMVPTAEPYEARRGQGIILAADGTKMSKSKGNVVDPTEIIDAGYGADALRLAIAFLAPYDQSTPWNPEGVAGTHRFLRRVWDLVQEHVAHKDDSLAVKSEELLRATHKTTKKISDDVQKMNFNTPVAALMELANDLYKLRATIPIGAPIWHDNLIRFVKLLAPFAPHIAEELWQQLGQKDSVHLSGWPEYDETYLTEKTVTIAVQINGKVRSQITTSPDASEAEAVAAAKSDPKIQRYTKGKPIKKTIYIPTKILNLIV
jgi:leucyl-tRNA synthetase